MALIASAPEIDGVAGRPVGWPRPMILGVAALGAYALAYLTIYVMRARASPGPMFGDFFAFWSFARFAHQFPAARIYDVAALQAFQLRLPGGFNGFYPYPYPPIFLLILWPLGWLGYIQAYLVWSGTTLAAYLAAVAGRDWRSPRLWLTIVAPTTLLSLVSGQNGLLTAALLIGGLRLLKARPILAGALLGMLSFKPQFFVLVPVVLLAGRQWRGLLGVALSITGLSLASAIAFGPSIWLDWLHATPTLLKLAEDNRQRLLSLMPTITAGLMDAGLPQGVAQAVQVVAALGAVGVLAWLFHRARKAGPGELEAAALQVGALLATPYAFIYDMPMVTPVAATAFQRGMSETGGWRIAAVGAPLLAYALPLLMLQGALKGWPVGAAVLVALFVVTVKAAASDAASAKAALI